jgi:hypothetical protein
VAVHVEFHWSVSLHVCVCMYASVRVCADWIELKSALLGLVEKLEAANLSHVLLVYVQNLIL